LVRGSLFNGVVKIRKLERIAQEKYGRVVAHEVPVSLFGVKLHRKTSNIALGISCATFPATVEKRKKQSVFFPTVEKIFALVYFIMSCVTVKVP